MKQYEHWLNHPGLDALLKEQLLAMDEKERYDAFYTNLEFGTAGMRGLLGPGTNRMNIYTIRKANVGFAKFIARRGANACKRGVAIAYDNRYMSKEFANESARVLALYGIQSYLFDALRPTPELSFAVRYLHCYGGIVITASHNPKEYNGYKIYDENGCQMVPEYVAEIVPDIKAITDELSIDVALSKEQEALIHTIGREVDLPYYEQVKSIQLHPELSKNDLKIVFTPQHGTALEAVKAVFNDTGYCYTLVKEQCTFDPAFSHTLTPNPEQADAYKLALDYARKIDADLVLSTDPDADRIGVAVKKDNDYVLMTGNQTGAVLLEYVFSERKKQGLLPDNAVMFNTVVTSDIGEKVAHKYGVAVEKTLTGFKFIGEKIAKHEQLKDKQFAFGYEESYGYLIKPFVRDKDAIQACLIIAEAANYYKQTANKTLWDVLLDLYHELGWYKESQVSLNGQGAEGATMIQSVMQKLRNEVLQDIAGSKVVRYEDYQSLTFTENGEEGKLDFPASDVLKYYLEDGCWIAIRPSGTEPKCKFYYCITGENEEIMEARDKAYKDAIAQLIRL